MLHLYKIQRTTVSDALYQSVTEHPRIRTRHAGGRLLSGGAPSLFYVLYLFIV